MENVTLSRENPIIEDALTAKNSFSSSLYHEAIAISSLPKEEKKAAKERKAAALEAIEKEYASLKSQNEKDEAEQIAKLKAEHEAELAKIKAEQDAQLAEVEKKWNALTPEQQTTKDAISERSDAIKGVDIIAKRARIKEDNAYELAEKDIKLEAVNLHRDYCHLRQLVTGRVALFKDVIGTPLLEFKQTFSLKRTLSNKQMWMNLIPLFMLILIIAAFYISRIFTHYNGSIVDVINNGVFIGIAATGAVYIYSSGSFDMSLGPASLMCATIGAIVWNATGQVAVALIAAVGLGILLGIVNAFLARVLDLPVMVMTLTMMNILTAVQTVILQTQGNELQVKEGMPNSTLVYAIYLVTFFLLCWSLFNYTKIGRRNKFIGSNQTAAKFSGVSLMKTGLISFGISGIGIGLAGFLFASYRSGSSFSTGTLLDTIGLNVVIAIVFGGMTTSGGPRSRVSCAIIGAFFAVFLDEFFRSLGLADVRYMAKGIVFLAVSFFNMYSTRPKGMLAR